MKKLVSRSRVAFALVLTIGAFGAGAAVAKEAPMSLYDFTVNTLAGKPQPLSTYKGKVTLVVNTASECGFTPQYKTLEALYKEYAPKGLVILGFPSNDFGGQEPGDAQQIHNFCEKNYGVTFPMFQKLETKGPQQAPLYKFLSAKAGEPKWNFHKYLVDKHGQVVSGFGSKVTPDSKELRDAIDAALKAD